MTSPMASPTPCRPHRFRSLALLAGLAAGLTLACGGGGGGGATPAAQQAPAPTIEAFTVEPAIVAPGGRARLSFRFSHGRGELAPLGAVATGESRDVEPQATTEYTLTVTDAQGRREQRTVTVTVAPLPDTSTPGAPAPDTSTPGAPAPGTSTPGAPAPGTPPPGGPSHPAPAAPTLRVSAFVTEFSRGNLATVEPQVPGLSYRWTRSDGETIVPGTLDSQIAFDVIAQGTFTLNCVTTDAAGQRSLPGTATVTVVPRATTPAILILPGASGPGSPEDARLLDAGATYRGLITPRPGCTYAWTIQNGDPTSPTDRSTVTFTARAAGLLRLSCVVTNAAGEPAPAGVKERLVAPPALAEPSAFMAGGLPYLQLGPTPSPESLQLQWLVPGDSDQDWQVEVLDRRGAWDRQIGLNHRLVDFGPALAATEPAHRIYIAPLALPEPGAEFCYRVRIGSHVVFQSRGKALRKPGQKQRVAIAGDLVSGDPAPTRRIVNQILKHKPDLMVVPGDMVNLEGHANQYRRALFSNYNSSLNDPAHGAPLMRQIALVGCLGNNDTDRVLEPRGFPPVQNPPAPRLNGLAYYYYFSQPLNGPQLRVNLGAVHDPAAMTPHLTYSFLPFLNAAGRSWVSAVRFPKMGNFSFDSGNVHWVVLDSNYYMDWSNADLQRWLDEDLRASTATWKIAVFHYPVFTHSTRHAQYRDLEGSRMRQLWPIFMRHGVSLTLSGHLHTYQRTRSMEFTGPASVTPATAVPPGYPTLDDAGIREDFAFTGEEPAASGPRPPAPQGIISIITGAGGAHLHPGQTRRPAGSVPDPIQFEFARHSFSLLETDGNRLTFSQLDENGHQLDRFVIVKP